ERQQATLVAAGAGAGIAAAFNAPLAGLLFAVEILLPEVSSATLVPVALATAAATTMGRIFLGPNPAFTIPALSIPSPQVANLPVLGAYAGLGLLLGVAALAGIRGIGGLNAWLEQHIRSPYLRHAASMLVVGLLIVWSLAHLGHYYVQGVGYAPIQDILSGTLTNARLLVLLFFLKLLATGLTLGSGGSGGIFSPSLFLGATLGGAYAVLLGSVVPGMAVSVPAFAAAGMAGMVAGMTGAAMTTIVMIFEMTLDYNVIIPMTVTVALSYGLRRLVLRESMYTWSLIRNGRFVPETLWRR
ncbi:MAG: chloride channel protein, partial [Anaerolineae bacterium]